MHVNGTEMRTTRPSEKLGARFKPNTERGEAKPKKMRMTFVSSIEGRSYGGRQPMPSPSFVTCLQGIMVVVCSIGSPRWVEAGVSLKTSFY